MKVFRRILIIVLIGAIAGALYWSRYHADSIVDRNGKAVTLLSRSHTIDRLYQSMQGPYSNQADFKLIESPGRELRWVTGLHCQLVAKDGSSPISREFFCHSNLTFTKQERVSGDFTSSQDYRLFTLIPGSLDINLP